jgi:RNA polymerase sigma factor (sigma-70 family)
MQARDLAARRAAWETWYRRDAPKLFTLLEQRGRRMGWHGDAEDLVQESFIAAFRNISGGRYVDQGAALGGYLYGIAKNLLYEALRLQRRELAGLESEETWAEDGLSLDDALVVNEVRRQVYEAQTRQSPLYRRVVDGLYCEGRSSDEVAVTVGKSAGNTRQIAYRAVNEIADYLKVQHNTHLSSHAIRTCLELR